MATSRMIVLRIFIEHEELESCRWQLITQNSEIDSGFDNLSNVLKLSFDSIEVYLAPTLATIFKVELGEISDKKITDELLLGLIEDNLADEIEALKPILMRLTTGEAFIAILNHSFYSSLVESFSDFIRQVKFIEPFPFITALEKNIWTLYLIGANKFIRTSPFEYILLDDREPTPLVLEQMLKTYDQTSLIIYSDNPELEQILANNYSLESKLPEELLYGNLQWNFYKEKSSRLNLKLTPENKERLKSASKLLVSFVIIYCFIWIVNFAYLGFKTISLKHQLQQQLAEIIKVDSYNPNLLGSINNQLDNLAHTKGVYNNSDALSLFNIFLTNFPSVDSNMLSGIKYSNGQLSVFLNSQYNTSLFANSQALISLKQISADLEDYKTYQSNQTGGDNQNNSSALLDNNNQNSTSMQMSDAAWVISLQVISKTGELNAAKATTYNK